MDGPEQGYLEARLHRRNTRRVFVSVAVIEGSIRKEKPSSIRNQPLGGYLLLGTISPKNSRPQAVRFRQGQAGVRDGLRRLSTSRGEETDIMRNASIPNLLFLTLISPSHVRKRVCGGVTAWRT